MIDEQGTHIQGSVGPGAAVGAGASVRARYIAGGSIHFNVPLPRPPKYPEPFIGRDRELEELRQLLPKNSNLMLTGIPGVGKTTLAAAAANQLAYVFRDGCLWANMSIYRSNMPSLLKRFVAHYWQEAPSLEKPDALAELLRSTLANKQVLMVLDNVDTADDYRYLQRLVHGSGSGLLIISDRQGFVQKVDIAAYELGMLTENDALRLLNSQSGRTLDLADRMVQKLLRHSRYHPNTLTQIAVQMRENPDRELQEWVTYLEERSVETDDLAKFGEALYRHTYNTLSEEQQRLFSLLGMLSQASCDPRMLSSILERNETELLADLDVLADMFLLIRDRGRQYHMEPLPYTFAQNVLQNRADFAFLWQRGHQQYLEWFVEAVETGDFADDEETLTHLRHLFSQAVARNDADTINLYHEKIVRRGEFSIKMDGGFVYHAKPLIPFVRYWFSIKDATLGNVDCEGGSGDSIHGSDSLVARLRLAGSRFEDIYLKSTTFVDCDLRSTRFGSIYLSMDSTFSNCNLSNARFDDIHVSSSTFSNCDLRGAHFRNIYVESSTFSNCDLRGAHFDNIYMESSTFSNCDLRNTRFDNLEMSNGTLNNCDLSGADHDRLELVNSLFTNCMLGSRFDTLRLIQCRAALISLENAYMQDFFMKESVLLELEGKGENHIDQLTLEQGHLLSQALSVHD